VATVRDQKTTEGILRAFKDVVAAVIPSGHDRNIAYCALLNTDPAEVARRLEAVS
jgi:hypothetical protein